MSKAKGWKRLTELPLELNFGEPFNPIRENVEITIRMILWKTRPMTLIQRNIYEELILYVNLRAKNPHIKFPTLKKLAEHHNTKKEYVDAQVKDLEKQKFIRVISGKGHAPSEYEILWHRLFAEEAIKRIEFEEGEIL
jgi:hypothetical protein